MARGDNLWHRRWSDQTLHGSHIWSGWTIYGNKICHRWSGRTSCGGTIGGVTGPIQCLIGHNVPPYPKKTRPSAFHMACMVLANLRTGLDQWTNTLTHYMQSSPRFIQVRLICRLALVRNTGRCARR